jgi:hypothetical protein
MMPPERQERCESLLREGLAEVAAAVLALAATQPELALEAYAALGRAVHPYLKGDRRAARLLVRLRQVERLLDGG